ncbi:hypothetical protein WMY93_001328 [Mugilogobius chulae]|uniref:Uncharacterized protein n=1 Tax=Mugilogobius chulae TaxID=88201 RepID=A0AAW0Q4Z8_9GOBI
MAVDLRFTWVRAAPSSHSLAPTLLAHPLHPAFMLKLTLGAEARQTGGPLLRAPPEMWPSCQPSNPVQPPPEWGKGFLCSPSSALSPPQSGLVLSECCSEPQGEQCFASQIYICSSP